MIERYKDKAISELWHPAAVYRRWHEVEVAHIREVAGSDAAEWLEATHTPSPHQVNYYERETGHDVAAFLVALDQNVQRMRRKLMSGLGPDEADPGVEILDRVRSSLHFGLTSSDVTDTALALGLMRSKPVVWGRVSSLIAALADFASSIPTWAATIGRTHGQLAAPMPADHRWAVLAEMLDRCGGRVDNGFSWLDVGKLSGPIGVSGTGEAAALDRLGLRDTTATQIVPRDRLAHWAHCMAELATVCEAIATQIWLLAQSGIAELRLVAQGTVGSSAMPHKVNPILAENVRGLARLARAAADTLQLGVVQWLEHDLAHSSVERVAVPDLLHLVCSILRRTTALVSGVVWEDPGRPAEYVDTSEELRAAQARGVPYVEAHETLSQTYRGGKIPVTTAPEETE